MHPSEHRPCQRRKYNLDSRRPRGLWAGLRKSGRVGGRTGAASMRSCPSISLSVCRINTCCGECQGWYERFAALTFPLVGVMFVVKVTAGFAVCRLILKIALVFIAVWTLHKIWERPDFADNREWILTFRTNWRLVSEPFDKICQKLFTLEHR